MVRTQIQLTEEQAREVRAAARREGISMAEMIRRCIDQALLARPNSREALYARAAELGGSFVDPGQATDLSSNHDRYLDEAFGSG
ncbi:ribbon-helix-helix protein, CopG family [Planctomycetota bacterium]